MSFQIGDALTDGIERTLAKNGLMLVVAFFVLSAVQTLFFPIDFETGAFASPAIGTPAVGWLVVFLISLASLYLMIVALRTFVTDERETIPDAALKERPVWAFLNLLLGGIAFSVLVGFGLVFFVVPGLFLLVTLWFFDVYVAVENDDFVTALRKSWSLTSGNRMALFVLGFAVIVITMAISIPFTIVDFFVSGILGALISQIGTAFGLVFTYATTATAFTQLRGPQPGDERSQTDDWDSSSDDQGPTPGVP